MIKKFEVLKLDIDNRVVDSETIVEAIGTLNSDLLNLQEEWLTLLDEDQVLCKQRFLHAQENFHVVGQALLNKAKAVETEKQIVEQLQFGTIKTVSATGVVTEIDPAMPVDPTPTSKPMEHEQDTIMPALMSRIQSTPPVFRQEDLTSAIKKALVV